MRFPGLYFQNVLGGMTSDALHLNTSPPPPQWSNRCAALNKVIAPIQLIQLSCPSKDLDLRL